MLTATPIVPHSCGQRLVSASASPIDVQRQGTDQGRALDVREELGRRQEATLGMPAPHERLDGRDRPAADVDDRLVVDDDLVLLQRRLELAHDSGVE